MRFLIREEGKFGNKWKVDQTVEEIFNLLPHTTGLDAVD